MPARRRILRSSPRSRGQRKRRLNDLIIPHLDKPFLITALLIALLGLFLIYDASIIVAHNRFGDPYYFVKHQILWFFVGLSAMLFSILLPLQWWQKNSRKFLYISVILLVLVFLGDKTLGARSWLYIAGFSLQPSELAKVTLTLYLANYLPRTKEPLKEFLKTAGLILALVVLQPDLGTALVIAASALSMYWVFGAPLKHFLAMVGAGIFVVLGLIMIAPYRLSRLLTFLDPSQDPLGTSYHVNQILISLGTGGLTGVGLGQSRQKFFYLPEVANDSIFAIFAEETGFIGSISLLLLFLIFFLRGIKIAAQAQNTFGRLCATGLISGIAVQAFINLSAMTLLVPLTGIPLPLISYGGSSLVVTLISVGIILNISGQAGFLSSIHHRRPK